MAWSIREVFSAFGYTLSLPERLVRSLAAAFGGTSKILTDLVVPEPLRRSNTYRAIVGNAQRFVIERVAEVEGVYAKDDAALPDNYVPRKIAGNVLEAAGMFSVHLSPLWVFAIATDVANGSKTYLRRLTDELKSAGVVSADAPVKELNDLLEAIGAASNESAKVFDAPPVDLSQIRQLRDQITAGYGRVFRQAGDLLPRIDTLWSRMEALAKRDHVSVDAVVGLMTVDLGKTAGKAVDAAFAVGNATTDLVAETIFQSYGETIERMQRDGVIACLDEAARPFVTAIAAQMDAAKPTWTQRALNRLMSPFASEPVAETGEPSAQNTPTPAPPDAAGGSESPPSSGTPPGES